MRNAFIAAAAFAAAIGAPLAAQAQGTVIVEDRATVGGPYVGIPHEQGVLIDLKLTNEQLAAICGISRQFANSTLQSLREQRLLAGAPGLILTDLAALERIAYNRQVSAR